MTNKRFGGRCGCECLTLGCPHASMERIWFVILAKSLLMHMPTCPMPPPLTNEACPILCATYMTPLVPTGSPQGAMLAALVSPSKEGGIAPRSAAQCRLILSACLTSLCNLRVLNHCRREARGGARRRRRGR